MGPLNASNSSFWCHQEEPVVADKVVVLPERGYAWAGSISPWVYTSTPDALGLVKQHLKVFQVMAGDEDARPVSLTVVFTLVISGFPKRRCVCRLEQGKGALPRLPALKDKRHHLRDREIFEGGGEPFLDKVSYRMHRFSQVSRRGGNRQTSPSARRRSCTERTDVFVRG